MKKAKKDTPKVSPCAERDRLWKAFLAAGKAWNLQQDKMAKDLRRDGQISPDVKKIQKIQEKIESSHRFFAVHIEKHGCGPAMAGTIQLEKKFIRKRK